MKRETLEKRLGLDHDMTQNLARVEIMVRRPGLGQVRKEMITMFVRREMVNFMFDDTRNVPVDETTIRGEAMERKLASLLLGMSRVWDVATNSSWFEETLEYYQKLRSGVVVGPPEQRQEIADAVAKVTTSFFGEKEITDGESVVLSRIVQYHFAEKHLGE